ncbi:MAG: hypothetical protein ABSG32_04465 [Terriglobia bacterium]|jgi:hypothetical protein
MAGLVRDAGLTIDDFKKAALKYSGLGVGRLAEHFPVILGT